MTQQFVILEFLKCSFSLHSVFYHIILLSANIPYNVKHNFSESFDMLII